MKQWGSRFLRTSLAFWRSRPRHRRLQNFRLGDCGPCLQWCPGVRPVDGEVRCVLCMCLLLLLGESSRCFVWYDMILICLRFLIRYMIFYGVFRLVGGSTIADRPTLWWDCVYRIPVFFEACGGSKLVASACTHVHDTAVILMRITYESYELNFETSFFHGSHCSNFVDMFTTWCFFCVLQQSAASPDLVRRWSHEGTVPSL